MYICIQSAAAAAAALFCYSYTADVAAVRHRVTDGKICCGFIESDSSVLLLLIQTGFCFSARTPWQYCRFHGLALTTSSVITSMRTKAGVWRASARPGEDPGAMRIILRRWYFIPGTRYIPWHFEVLFIG